MGGTARRGQRQAGRIWRAGKRPPEKFLEFAPVSGLFRNSRNRGACELSDSDHASRTARPALTRIVVALQVSEVFRARV